MFSLSLSLSLSVIANAFFGLLIIGVADLSRWRLMLRAGYLKAERSMGNLDPLMIDF
jgi:hypothetical protein